MLSAVARIFHSLVAPMAAQVAGAIGLGRVGSGRIRVGAGPWAPVGLVSFNSFVAMAVF